MADNDRLLGRGTFKAIGAIAVSVLTATLAIAAIKPADAVANLSGWFAFFHFDTASSWLLSARANHTMQMSAVALLSFYIGNLPWLIARWRGAPFAPNPYKIVFTRRAGGIGQAGIPGSAFSSPTPDMSLNDAVAHIISRTALGWELLSTEAQMRDLALAFKDQAAFGRLTMWGRPGDKAIAKIDPHWIDQATFNFPEQFLHVYGTQLEWRDVKVCKAQVEKLWPIDPEAEEKITARLRQAGGDPDHASA